MSNPEKIRIAIVDDHKEWIDSLIENLSVYSEAEVCGTATNYKQAIDLLQNEKPDLVFLDVEMPGKSGFELLDEVRELGIAFSVIFYTAYDKYMIKALREQALDYILKPIDPAELKIAIDRYNVLRETEMALSQLPVSPNSNGNSEKIALPTYLGLQFIEKNRIVLFQCIRGGVFEKPSWEALLIDSTQLKLSKNITSEKIHKALPKECYFQINQSCIINIAFLSGLIYKTHECLLIPPFDKMKLSVSKSQINKMKEIFDVF